jgi:membrane dipeptidase
MDCCGHAHGGADAAPIWGIVLPPIGAMLAGEVESRGSTAAARSAEAATAAIGALRQYISVDVHSHGGKTGITSKAPPSGDLADAMLAGSLAVACLADVPDPPVLGRNEGVLAAVRRPAQGELYRYHLDRLAWMDELVSHGLRRALCAPPGGRPHHPENPAAPRHSPAEPPARLNGAQLRPGNPA